MSSYTYMLKLWAVKSGLGKFNLLFLSQKNINLILTPQNKERSHKYLQYPVKQLSI